ncbi:MAG: hypothetical protein ACRD2N_21785, partial [Vicinamibacterales bacterium]
NRTACCLNSSVKRRRARRLRGSAIADIVSTFRKMSTKADQVHVALLAVVGGLLSTPVLATLWAVRRSSALSAFLLVFLASGVICSTVFYLTTAPATSPPSEPMPTPSARKWDADAQRTLVERIRDYSSDASVQFRFAHAPQRATVDSLKGAFDFAGWKTEVRGAPLDSIADAGYFDGIEVQGYNRLIVELVASSLKESGLGEIRTRIDELKVPKTNPKWPYANQRVRLTLGHATIDEPVDERSFALSKLSDTLKLFDLPFDGLSSPQEKPTPENDVSHSEYFKLSDERYLRMTGATLTPEQYATAHALILVHEVELKKGQK